MSIWRRRTGEECPDWVGWWSLVLSRSVYSAPLLSTQPGEGCSGQSERLLEVDRCIARLATTVELFTHSAQRTQRPRCTTTRTAHTAGLDSLVASDLRAIQSNPSLCEIQFCFVLVDHVSVAIGIVSSSWYPLSLLFSDHYCRPVTARSLVLWCDLFPNHHSRQSCFPPPQFCSTGSVLRRAPLRSTESAIQLVTEAQAGRHMPDRCPSSPPSLDAAIARSVATLALRVVT